MIVIVGAGGFLGYSLSRYFSLAKVEFATISRSFQWPRLLFEKRFVGNASNAISFLSAIDGDLTVLYMAGSPNLLLAEKDPFDDLSCHLNELRGFLDIFSNQHCSSRKFIFFSSGGTVYGDSNGEAKSEDSALIPKSSYGRRNVALEKLVVSFSRSSGFLFSIFRITNPFGPGQYRFRRRGLIQALVDSAYSGQKVLLRANGLQKRDYIYSELLCFMVNNILQHNPIPEVVNIASGFSYTAREVISILEKNKFYPSFDYIDDSDSYEVIDSIVSSELVRSIVNLTADDMYPFNASNLLSMSCFQDEET